MTTQPLGTGMDSLRGFGVERRARLAVVASRPQHLLSGFPRTSSAAARTNCERIARQSPTKNAANWLEGALAQVDQVDRDAEEEGYPAIGELAKRNAKHLLVMAARSSIEPDVYPSMDGEVALFFRSPKAQAGLLILLDNSGGAGCFWSTGGKSERKHYEDALKLPPDVLSTQLRALGGSPLWQSVE